MRHSSGPLCSSRPFAKTSPLVFAFDSRSYSLIAPQTMFSTSRQCTKQRCSSFVVAQRFRSLIRQVLQPQASPLALLRHYTEPSSHWRRSPPLSLLDRASRDHVQPASRPQPPTVHQRPRVRCYDIVQHSSITQQLSAPIALQRTRSTRIQLAPSRIYRDRVLLVLRFSVSRAFHTPRLVRQMLMCPLHRAVSLSAGTLHRTMSH